MDGNLETHPTVEFVQGHPLIYHSPNRQEATELLSSIERPFDLQLALDWQHIYNSATEPYLYLTPTQEPSSLQFLCTQTILNYTMVSPIEVIDSHCEAQPATLLRSQKRSRRIPQLPDRHPIRLPSIYFQIELDAAKMVDETPTKNTIKNILLLPTLSVDAKTHLITFFTNHLNELYVFDLFKKACQVYHQHLNDRIPSMTTFTEWPGLYFHVDTVRMVEQVLHYICTSFWSWRYLSKLMTRCHLRINLNRNVSMNSAQRLNIFPELITFSCDRFPTIPKNCPLYDLRLWKDVPTHPAMNREFPFEMSAHSMNEAFRKLQILHKTPMDCYDFDYTCLRSGSLVKITWNHPWQIRRKMNLLLLAPEPENEENEQN